MGNIHQIHLQLIIRCSVIFSVHLCVTSEASLCLQTQRKLRHFFTVLCCDFRTLRARTYNGQVTLQDVHQLRQLIQTASTDNMANLRDAVILVTGGKASHAVLFSIHTHRTELQDLEGLTILGQTHLLIECRAAIRLHRNRRDQENRAKNDQGHQGQHNVHCTLDKEELRLCHISTDSQHRKVKHVHRPGTTHQNIAHTRNDKRIDVVHHTILQDDVALMAVNAAEEYGLHTIQNTQIFQALLYAQNFFHLVLAVQTVVLNQLFHTTAHIIDHGGRLRRECFVIPAMCNRRPDASHHKLSCNGSDSRQKIAQLRGHQADHNVKDPVRRHRRQDLTVHQLGNSLHGHPECIIGLAQQNKQHSI